MSVEILTQSDSPERLGAVELPAVRGGEVTVDVLQNQVLHITEHVAQVSAHAHTPTHTHVCFSVEKRSDAGKLLLTL